MFCNVVWNVSHNELYSCHVKDIGKPKVWVHNNNHGINSPYLTLKLQWVANDQLLHATFDHILGISINNVAIDR